MWMFLCVEGYRVSSIEFIVHVVVHKGLVCEFVAKHSQAGNCDISVPFIGICSTVRALEYVHFITESICT